MHVARVWLLHPLRAGGTTSAIPKWGVQECADELVSLLQEENLQNVPMLVYANKQDLQFALDADQVMEKLKLADISDRTWNIQACSAFTKEGLSDGMEWLIKTISTKQAGK